jgi:autotransporter-associated beta strand protein
MLYGGGGAISVSNAATTLILAGLINDLSGPGELTKSGAGKLTLTNTNTYTGTTTVSGGTLSGNSIADQGVNSAFGRGNFAISNGALLQYTGGTASTNRAITLGSGGGQIVTNSPLTLSGLVEGSGGLTTHASPLAPIVLTNPDNSYEGPTNIRQATLRGNSIADAGVNSAFGRGNFIMGLNFATLYYDGPSASTNRTITLSGDDSFGGTIFVAQPGVVLTLTGVISGPGDLVIGGSGVVRLDASNTYGSDTFSVGGYTHIDGSTLRLGNHERIPDRSAVYVDSFTGDATFDLNNFNETIGSLAGDATVTLGSGNLTTGGNGQSTTFSGVISGSGGLTKQGSGTMTLTGVNTYTGGTTINGGKLTVSGSILGSVTVNSGGTFGGSTTVSGNVTGGGRVAPGNSPGILIIDGDYTQTASSALEIEVGGRDLDGTPGVDFDQVQVGGAAALAGLLEVPIVNGYVPALNDQVTFLTAQGGVTGVFNSLVSPNLATVNPNVALEVIKHPTIDPTEVRLRFAAPSTDIQFDDTVTEPASWSDEDSWTTDTVPGTVNVIDLENAPGTTQRINVEDANALVHQLTVTGNDGTMIVGVKNGNFLSATVGTTVADQAVIELDNGNLASPSVAIEDGALLAGNGTVRANLSISGGMLRPGFSVGHLDVKGDYDQHAAGTLLIDVTGAAGASHDTIDVTGQAEIDGTLSVNAAGFVPGTVLDGTYGVPIPILDAASRTGTFDTLETTGNDDVVFVPMYGAGGGSGQSANSCDVAVCVGGFYLGDMNHDSLVNPADASFFAMALSDPDKYAIQTGANGAFMGDEGWLVGDIGNTEGPDGQGKYHPDGRLTFDDIPAFAAKLGMSTSALWDLMQVPEPASAVMMSFSGLMIALCRSRPRRKYRA